MSWSGVARIGVLAPGRNAETIPDAVVDEDELAFAAVVSPSPVDVAFTVGAQPLSTNADPTTQRRRPSITRTICHGTGARDKSGGHPPIVHGMSATPPRLWRR
jgi:hypothetical protein